MSRARSLGQNARRRGPHDLAATDRARARLRHDSPHRPCINNVWAERRAAPRHVSRACGTSIATPRGGRPSPLRNVPGAARGRRPTPKPYMGRHMGRHPDARAQPAARPAAVGADADARRVRADRPAPQAARPKTSPALSASPTTQRLSICRPGNRWSIAKDAIVSGVHFFADDPADAVAQKLLRVNLSDLAAMGAEPVAYLTVIARPRELADAWLEGFARGLANDQERFGLSLIGGDVVSTPGPLLLSCTILGQVETGRALRRSTARADDRRLGLGHARRRRARAPRPQGASPPPRTRRSICSTAIADPNRGWRWAAS